MAKKSPNERALLYLKSRLWVEGCVHIASSQGVLDYANDRDCNFIPLTDVTVFGNSEADTVTVDFLAVNVEEIRFMTTYIGESDPVFRERIAEMLSRHKESSPEESWKSAARDLVTWLGDEVVGRLNTCVALWGNGRSDDRITGVKLVVNQLVTEITERTALFGTEEEGEQPPETDQPEPPEESSREESER
jgi:hypothetical protein